MPRESLAPAERIIKAPKTTIKRDFLGKDIFCGRYRHVCAISSHPSSHYIWDGRYIRKDFFVTVWILCLENSKQELHYFVCHWQDRISVKLSVKCLNYSTEKSLCLFFFQLLRGIKVLHCESRFKSLNKGRKKLLQERLYISCRVGNKNRNCLHSCYPQVWFICIGTVANIQQCLH